MRVTRRGFIGRSAAALVAAQTMAKAQTAPAATPKMRACVIGDGNQGMYGHSMHLAWATREDVEVVGLADPNEETRAKASASAKAQRTYADYREMLEKEKPELVVVGPRFTIHHKEYLLACAAVGAHGFMEKPVSHDLAEADAMVQAVEAKNLKWAVAYNFRASAQIAHARRMVMEEGLIGDVLEIRARGKEDERAGGEDMIVLGTHSFDALRYFLGNPLWCESDITVDGRAATRADIHDASEPVGPVMGDRIRAMFGFPNSIVGYFTTTKNTHGYGGRWGMDIYGSRGMVTIRINGGINVWLLRDPMWAPGGRDKAWEPIPDMPPFDEKQPEMERNAPIVADLIAAIKENRRPKVSLQDGRDSTEMIQAVYEAYLHGGRVPFPLKERTHPLTRPA